MDFQDILTQKIKALPEGRHVDGLKAVMSHIEAAVRHFERGQTGPDETLFTDVIFRCNQAFEGSIKEAYRVLTGKDPQKKSPHEIEQYLTSGSILRKKVLDQFTNYRTEWRNPSTHDYTLDFDEDEALLAINAVTVFSIVLCDQIDSKIAFDSAAANATGSISSVQKSGPLIDLVTSKALTFAEMHVDSTGPTRSPAHDYYRLEGALAGYLSAELTKLPGLTVDQNVLLAGREADIVIQRGSDKVVVELKRTSSAVSIKGAAAKAIAQVSLYLHEPEVSGGVILIYSNSDRKYAISPAPGALSDVVKIVVPK